MLKVIQNFGEIDKEEQSIIDWAKAEAEKTKKEAEEKGVSIEEIYEERKGITWLKENKLMIISLFLSIPLTFWILRKFKKNK